MLQVQCSDASLTSTPKECCDLDLHVEFKNLTHHMSNLRITNMDK
jgi:hypothetical protein